MHDTNTVILNEEFAVVVPANIDFTLPIGAATQSVLDAFPFYVLIIDEGHNIQAANKAMRDQLGMPDSQIIGRWCPRLVHGLEVVFPGCPLGEAIATGSAATKELHDLRNGRWALSACYPLPATTATGERLFLHTAIDITDRKKAESREHDAMNRLHQSLVGTVSLTARAVEAKNPYTAGHQRRVAALSAAIATALEMPFSSIEAVNLAASVHDIGKIGIPAEILNKPGRLTDEEFETIKRHPAIGCAILEPVAFPWPIAQMVLQHHERLDGSGYPSGLVGRQIMLESRIIAVADVVEAMMLARPYRPALGLDAALAEISAGRGVKFDADVVDACLALFDRGFDMAAVDSGPSPLLPSAVL